MPTPHLHPEIWAHIIEFLERPKPPPGTEDWKELHQHDLATMAQVSKMHCDLTTPILYREPIVGDWWTFFDASNTSTPIQTNAYSTSIPDRRTTSIHRFTFVKKFHLIYCWHFRYFYYSTLFQQGGYSGGRSRNCAYIWSVWPDSDDPTNVDAQMIDSLVFQFTSFDLLARIKSSITSSAGKQFRPSTLTFGSWGTRSWNQEHIAMEESLEQYEGEWKQAIQRTKQSIFYFGVAMRANFSNVYAPRVHCSHFAGGPLGSYGPGIMAWQYTPRVTITHAHVEDFTYSFTIGCKNIIFYHKDEDYIESRYSPRSAPLMCLKQMVETWEKVTKSPTKHALSMWGKAEDTTIDIYGTPGDLCGGSLKQLQKKLSAELSVLRGKVKLHRYEEAPACPACGWSRGQI